MVSGWQTGTFLKENRQQKPGKGYTLKKDTFWKFIHRTSRFHNRSLIVEYIFMMVISNVYNVCLEGFADDKAFHAINYSESAKLRP